MKTWDLGLSAMTEQQLDEIALSQVGIVGRLDANGIYSPQPSLPVIGGWTGQWLQVNGLNGGHSLALKSLNSRTRALAREGKLRYYENSGLSREHADTLHRFDVRYKIELAPTLAKILADPVALNAFTRHPLCGDGQGDQRKNWTLRHYQTFAEYDLPISKEIELARMVMRLTRRRFLDG